MVSIHMMAVLQLYLQCYRRRQYILILKFNYISIVQMENAIHPMMHEDDQE